MNLSVISKKLRQNPVLVVCGILIPLTLILLFMRGSKIEEYESQLSELEREWRTINTNIERSTGLEEDIEAIEAGVETIQDRLMNVDEVAANYEFFYDLERQAGVSVSQFSQGMATDGKALALGREAFRHFSIVPYDIAMTGTLPQILSFVDLLDRQEFIIRLDLLNITRGSSQNTETDQLSARLKCHVLAAKNE